MIGSDQCDGEACPLPVVKTLRALQSLGGAGAWRRWSTMKRRQNLRRLAESKGCSIEVETISTPNTASPSPQRRARSCRRRRRSPALPRRRRKDRRRHLDRPHARGNEELGRALLWRSCSRSRSRETLPAAILFYTPARPSPAKARPRSRTYRRCRAGASRSTCGTCLNYYGLTEKLRVGEVTNMYVIAEKQLQADCIIPAREPMKPPGHPQDDRAIFMQVMDCGNNYDKFLQNGLNLLPMCRERTRAPYFTKYGALAA